MVASLYSLAVITVGIMLILGSAAVILRVLFLNEKRRSKTISIIDIERINVTGGSPRQHFVLAEKGILVNVKSSLHEL